jgi:3-oxoacyl-[acyl-carrier protein] reductase
MTLPEFHNVALVTGAGRGLGAVIAHALANASYKVVVSDIDLSRAQSVAHDIDPTGEHTMPLALDVTEKDSFEAALRIISKRWGGVGVLVNNAAVTKTTPIFEISPQEFLDVTSTNLLGTFLGCQVFGHHFVEAGYGRIINMASLAAQNGGAATGAHYAASKGGIVTLTKVFARDLAQKGVTVNAVSPGPLDVDLVHEMLSPEKLEAVVGSIPVGTLGDPKFIGQIVTLLASPDAASITGSTVDANGGLYVR